MKGFIKITATETEEGANIGVEVDLHDLGGVVGKAALLDAFLSGLNVDTREELKMMLALRDIVHKSREVKKEGE